MMNRNLETFDADVTLSLDDTPLPLRLPVGAAIFAQRGNVWITQERLHDDIVLAPGERFDVKGAELILASAIKGSATVHVVPPPEARIHGESAFHDFLRARAARLRAKELPRLSGLVGTSFAGWVARAGGSMTPRPRAVSH